MSIPSLVLVEVSDEPEALYLHVSVAWAAISSSGAALKAGKWSISWSRLQEPRVQRRSWSLPRAMPMHHEEREGVVRHGIWTVRQES